MESLIEACKKGIPDEVLAISKVEGEAPGVLAKGIANGTVVLLKNERIRKSSCAIGQGCSVKVNVNIGTSSERCDPDLEIIKAQVALANGADTLMDLSTAGDLTEIRHKILNLNAPLGTVPIYEAIRKAGNVQNIDSELLFRVIREQCRQGVDFMTLHCGVNKSAFSALKSDPRLLGVVSRGGAFHVAMIATHGEENPLFKEFDYLLEILKEYEVVLSLGDGMRPGCLYDAGKRAKSTEYLTLGELAQRSLSAGVQRMIEGPGHIPIDQIGYNVDFLKEVTANAPLYLLGPLVTDIAPGYDHIVGAIGGAVACMHKADFLCMVSPSEHLSLPDTNDIIEGTRAAKIAAHIGDLIRKKGGIPFEREVKMAEARRDLDWNEQFSTALFGENARRIHDRDGESDTCSMCGDLCAVRLVRDLFRKEEQESSN